MPPSSRYDDDEDFDDEEEDFEDVDFESDDDDDDSGEGGGDRIASEEELGALAPPELLAESLVLRSLALSSKRTIQNLIDQITQYSEVMDADKAQLEKKVTSLSTELRRLERSANDALDRQESEFKERMREMNAETLANLTTLMTELERIEAANEELEEQLASEREARAAADEALARLQAAAPAGAADASRSPGPSPGRGSSLTKSSGATEYVPSDEVAAVLESDDVEELREMVRQLAAESATAQATLRSAQAGAGELVAKALSMQKSLSGLSGVSFTAAGGAGDAPTATASSTLVTSRSSRIANNLLSKSPASRKAKASGEGKHKSDLISRMKTMISSHADTLRSLEESFKQKQVVPPPGSGGSSAASRRGSESTLSIPSSPSNSGSSRRQRRGAVVTPTSDSSQGPSPTGSARSARRPSSGNLTVHMETAGSTISTTSAAAAPSRTANTPVGHNASVDDIIFGAGASTPSATHTAPAHVTALCLGSEGTELLVGRADGKVDAFALDKKGRLSKAIASPSPAVPGAVRSIVVLDGLTSKEMPSKSVWVVGEATTTPVVLDGTTLVPMAEPVESNPSAANSSALTRLVRVGSSNVWGMGSDAMVHVWSGTSGVLTKSIVLEGEVTAAVAAGKKVDPSGKCVWLAVGRRLLRYRASKGTKVDALHMAHTDRVTALEVAGADRVFSASRDGSVVVWVASTGVPLGRFQARQGPLSVCVGVGPIVFTGGSAATVRGWHRLTGRLARRTSGVAAGGVALAVGTGGLSGLLVTVAHDSTSINVWSLSKKGYDKAAWPTGEGETDAGGLDPALVAGFAPVPVRDADGQLVSSESTRGSTLTPLAADATGAALDAELKHWKMRKMVLVGQVGALTKQLAAPDLSDEDAQQLTSMLSSSRLDLQNVDGEITRLSQAETPRNLIPLEAGQEGTGKQLSRRSSSHSMLLPSSSLSKKVVMHSSSGSRAK
jgi:hypothetical protein